MMNLSGQDVIKMCWIIVITVALAACSPVLPTEDTAETLSEDPVVPVTEEPVCCGTEKTVNREVFVFDDANANGKYDLDEVPLADVLITSYSNIHGGNERVISTTDDSGRAHFDVTFTHFFDIEAVPLCGYTPTTPSVQDATETDRLQFGMAPEQPRAGKALVRFFVWFDADRDGIEDSDELPIAHTNLKFNLTAESREQRIVVETAENDALAVRTDGDGWAEINLGNTCGPLYLWTQEFEPWSYGHWQIASAGTGPGPITQSEAQEYVDVAYDLGETVIKVGLAQVPEVDGDQEVRAARREVVVFEDANENGTYDAGELPLPDVPVFSWASYYGVSERKVAYTDQNGLTTVDAVYRQDEFWIKSALPCGYAPTTPIVQQAGAAPLDDDVQFGFAAVDPVASEAVVRVHLWLDQDDGSQQDSVESPVAGAVLHVYPRNEEEPDFGWVPWRHLERDGLAIFVDENGWGEFYLGNTCGEIEVHPTFERTPPRWRVTSFNPTPAAFMRNNDTNPSYRFFVYEYGPGETVIELGVVPD